MSSALETLRKYTTIVADTGIIESISEYKPQDSTTNPSLILAAIKTGKYDHFVEEAVKYGNSMGTTLEEKCEFAFKRLLTNPLLWILIISKLVKFGIEILKIIPGRVSTEVDAKYSFDTEATIDYALKLIELYKEHGIDKKRILIKIAATWEGIKAAEILEKKYEIHCNLTLIFSFAQAVACAEASVTLISPFVGRILDWYKKNTGEEYNSENDPGVVSVKEIYYYYKKYDYNTIIMGASFRNIGEIVELAGIDFLTISPSLLKELASSNEPFSPKLNPENAKHMTLPKTELNEPKFRFLLNENQMATEKLSEGIRNFTKDGQQLYDLINKKISSH